MEVMQWRWTDFYLWALRTTRHELGEAQLREHMAMMSGSYAALATGNPTGFQQLVPGTVRTSKMTSDAAAQARARAEEISAAVKRGSTQMLL